MQKNKNKALFLSIFSNSVYLFLGKLFGAVLGFLITVIVARSLGPTEAGIYFLAITAITLFSTITRVGADSSIIKFIGLQIKNNNMVGAINYSTFFIILVGFSTILIGFVLVIIARLGFEDYLVQFDNYLSPFWFVVYSLLFNTLLVISQILLGINRSRISIIFSSVVYQAILLILLFIFKPETSSESIYYFGYSVFSSFILAVIVFTYIFYKKGAFTTGFNPSQVNYSRVYQSCAPLFVFSFMGQIAQWAPQIFLGIYSTPYDVSMLAIAQRVSLALSFILIAVNYSVSTRIVDAYKDENILMLKGIVRHSGHIMILFGAPLLLICIFFADLVISIFGSEYHPASNALIILAIGQFANIITGPTGYLLIMTNNESIHRNSQIIAALTCLLFCFLLIPNMGFVGAAFAVSLGVILQNIYAAWGANKKLGINVLKEIWQVPGLLNR